MKKVISLMAAAAACLCFMPLSACADEESASSYEIVIEYDGDRTVAGSVKFTFANGTGNALESLCFNLWGNAYREGAAYAPVSEAVRNDAYYGGESYGGMEIKGVEGGAWSVRGGDENILEIALDSAIYPDECATVVIYYELYLADVNHRTGIAENAVNLGNFYPVLCAYGQAGYLEYTYCATGDPFVSDTADYTVELTMPQGYTAAASGELVQTVTSGGATTCSYRIENARDFALVLSDKFNVISREAGGARVYYYYCDDGEAESKLNIAADSMEWFSEQFGDYPYATLSVVQTGFCHGGMEYPALTMISDACGDAEALYAIVHENAHQWWYAAVGSDGYLNGWQDEGLAEYSALMYFENTPQYGITKAGLLGTATKAYRAYYSVYSQLFEGADTSMDRALDEYSGDYEYANIAYNKALLMFDAVRSACGDRGFISALRDYRKEYLFAIAPPEGLIAAFCRYGDCEGIFSGFIEGNVII